MKWGLYLHEEKDGTFTDKVGIVREDGRLHIATTAEILSALPDLGEAAKRLGWAPPQPPFAIVGRAEPAPPVPGRVGFYIERIIPAEDVDAVTGRRRHILASHIAQMATEVAGSLEEEKIGRRPYRIRISVEPEE